MPPMIMTSPDRTTMGVGVSNFVFPPATTKNRLAAAPAPTVCTLASTHPAKTPPWIRNSWKPQAHPWSAPSRPGARPWCCADHSGINSQSQPLAGAFHLTHDTSVNSQSQRNDDAPSMGCHVAHRHSEPMRLPAHREQAETVIPSRVLSGRHVVSNRSGSLASPT